MLQNTKWLKDIKKWEISLLNVNIQEAGKSLLLGGTEQPVWKCI